MIERGVGSFSYIFFLKGIWATVSYTFWVHGQATTKDISIKQVKIESERKIEIRVLISSFVSVSALHLPLGFPLLLPCACPNTF